MNILYIVFMLLILIIGIVLWFTLRRNFFTKHKYIRLVSYNKDMSVSVKYFKRENFNKNNIYLINDKHIYNFNGYTTVVITSESQESINPIDFESKYPADKFKTAIGSHVARDMFNTLEVSKIDKMSVLIALNVITLIGIAYLLYIYMGAGA